MGERISRLMDGELEGAEADAAIRELRDPDRMGTWVCYHVIGDALRGIDEPTPGFAERFAERLKAEPTVVAPKPRQPHGLPFVWAAAATVAAISVVGWVAVSTLGPQPQVLARAKEAMDVRALKATAPPVLPDYLIAHQEYSPTVQIQGIGPYLRAASAGADGRP